MRSQVTVSGKLSQRSALACSTCRIKRVKCDCQHPSCSTCNTAGEICEYTAQDSNRKPPSKCYVEALQERIRTLEAQLERFQSDAGSQDRAPLNSIEDTCSNSEGDSIPDDSISYRSPIRDTSDRLGALNIGEDGQIHYFGSRSNFSLLKNSPVASSTVSSHDLQKQAADTLDQLNLLVEVSDELQNHLLDLFWRWQNTWQYLVVKELFLEDLHINHSGRYALPLLLSAVLALAARYSDRVELRTDPLDQNTARNALAEQAKTILFYESQVPKVTTVQATALLGLREIATDKEALGWMYCGIAARMAFNLGLHLDRSHWADSGHITKDEAEVGTIVWWGCYVLDKLFNIGLGRPSTIQEHEISAVLPSFEHSAEYESWNSKSPLGEPIVFPRSHQVSNVCATVQLFRVTSSALDEIYRPGSQHAKSRIMELVTKTHVNIIEFQINLPSCLRLLSPSPLATTLPHIYLLHLQIHVAVILLHRPFVGVQRRTLDPGSFHPSTGSSHLKECSQSSHSISNIFKLYSKHYTLRRIPISAIHCAFTASIILLLEATSTDSKDRDSAIASLKVLAEALTDMSTAWAWSQRALLAIRQLAREWSVSEDAFGALGIIKSECGKATGDAIIGTTQALDGDDSSSSLWVAEGAYCFDMDIPFMTREGLNYQGWIGTLFTEPGLPQDAT
ncbi:fungal-specific transcription factor domain-containing protein [Fusarium redolens]|uniref:Fungal-specific transcription factor domain-containing protein n=1 Tax=Fusarium redolens TaxID=48865 RepID=A0A9P9KSS1_FUSRE|nr:fungal-specific transcription factor domain-containing protein [Fusarium redolens]KAH7267839.1 fungal-specific transcription factor domain-containing protein [Fusarium redolens]